MGGKKREEMKEKRNIRGGGEEANVWERKERKGKEKRAGGEEGCPETKLRYIC